MSTGILKIFWKSLVIEARRRNCKYTRLFTQLGSLGVDLELDVGKEKAPIARGKKVSSSYYYRPFSGLASISSKHHRAASFGQTTEINDA
jgi:hypothetical protein